MLDTLYICRLSLTLGVGTTFTGMTTGADSVPSSLRVLWTPCKIAPGDLGSSDEPLPSPVSCLCLGTLGVRACLSPFLRRMSN